MNKTPTGIALAAFLTTAALAQTSTSTTKRPAAHHSTTTSSTTRTSGTTVANPADNPPNVPPIPGVPKSLYALRYIDTLIGTGDLAQPQKYYTVRYTGWLTDGTKFDSSDDHPGKEPFSFAYGAHRVITGWDTGFEGMRVGGKRRIFIPYQLAYGESGRPPVIPPKADLIFDMELVGMSDTDPTAAPTMAPAAQPSSSPQDTTKPATQPADPTKPTSASPPPSSNPSTPQSTAPATPK